MEFQEKETFNHPPSQEELLAAYRKSEETDPTSIYYKRKLVRPKLHPWRVLSFCLLTLVLATLFGVVVFFLTKSLLYAILTGVFCVLSIIIIFLKSILIWFVHVYQHFASDERRERCRFEPSCSEYMIQALQKYGVIKGLIKGIKRLLRCKPPNGGFDPP